MKRTLRDKNFFLFVFSCFLFFIVSYAIRSYIISKFMVSDDAIFLPKSLFGMADIGWSAPTVHLLVDLLSNLQSLSLFKIVSLAVYSAASGIVAVIFFRYVNGVVLAILLAFVIGGAPVSADQVIFDIGSHPTFALLFILIALLAFDHVRGISGVSFIIVHLGVPSILFGAANSSPIAFLAPVALPIWLVIAWSISGKVRTTIMGMASGAGSFYPLGTRYVCLDGARELSLHRACWLDRIYAFTGAAESAQRCITDRHDLW